MKATVVDATRSAEWDALVAEEPAFSLTQSWGWGTFKESLGWRVHRVAVEDRGVLVAGAQLTIRRLPLGLAMAYVPRGPVGAWRGSEEVTSALFAELERLARAAHAAYLKIEPAVREGEIDPAVLERQGFRPSRVTNQPMTTIVVDITRPLDEMLRGMRKETRRYVRRAEREDLTIRRGGEEDLPAFVDLMRTTAKREGFAPRTLDYYRAEWETSLAHDRGVLLLAYHDDSLIGVRTVHAFGRHAAEFHAASIPMRGLHANYLLVWRGIEWAHEKGLETYDLWGVPDEARSRVGADAAPASDRHDGLWGVYQFKRGFCPDVVRYLGAYDQVYSPLAYHLIESPFVRREMWERIAAWLDSASAKQGGSEGTAS